MCRDRRMHKPEPWIWCLSLLSKLQNTWRWHHYSVQESRSRTCLSQGLISANTQEWLEIRDKIIALFINPKWEIPVQTEGDVTMSMILNLDEKLLGFCWVEFFYYLWNDGKMSKLLSINHSRGSKSISFSSVWVWFWFSEYLLHTCDVTHLVQACL